jgi:predicted O-methyltransferase YrrM
LTTRDPTGLLPRADAEEGRGTRKLRESAFTIAFSAVQWPWLLKSLFGGTRADKQSLLAGLGLPGSALPHLGSWKADTYFLHRIVDTVAELRPARVVELGSGASSLVIAKALALNGGGALTSYDQHPAFLAQMPAWLAEHGLSADFRHAPLTSRSERWPGLWYDLAAIPPAIDLLVIDGPPWTLHPFVRGRAETLFDRIVPGGVILLDDAARPGERFVARRWQRQWPQFAFQFEGGGTKGTLVGRRRPG